MTDTVRAAAIVRAVLRSVAYNTADSPLDWYAVRDRVPANVSDVFIVDTAELAGIQIASVPKHVTDRASVRRLLHSDRFAPFYPAVKRYYMRHGVSWLAYANGSAIGSIARDGSGEYHAKVGETCVVFPTLHEAVSFLLGAAQQ